jgi:hypothetical protein
MAGRSSSQTTYAESLCSCCADELHGHGFSQGDSPLSDPDGVQERQDSEDTERRYCRRCSAPLGDTPRMSAP